MISNTKCINECTVNEKLTSDNQVLTSDNQVLTSDNQVLTSDNQVLTSDNQVLTSDNQVLTSDNQVLTNDNQNENAIIKSTNKQLYNQNITFEKFINYKLINSNHKKLNYIFIPSQLQNYNEQLISNLANFYNVNRELIKFINNNLKIYILNSHNLITNVLNNILPNKYLEFSINSNTNLSNFNITTTNYILHLLNDNKLYQINLGYYNEYFTFVNFILVFYKYNCERLIELVNYNKDIIISINSKINKILNCVSFLQENNTKVVEDFVLKRVDEYQLNKIILEYYEKFKELEFSQKDKINYIFTKHDLRVITHNLLNNRYLNQKYKKNIYLSFIFKMLYINDLEFNNIKLEVATIDVLYNKTDVNVNIIYDIINKINTIESEITYLKYNIMFYAHRQQIIYDYGIYLKTLYSTLTEEIGKDNAYAIFKNLIIVKKSNQYISKFMFTIINTSNENLIFL